MHFNFSRFWKYCISPVEQNRPDQKAILNQELARHSFLKMIIQGTESIVLNNGTQKQKSCISMQVEVVHSCLYENQTKFSVFYLWMRKNSFVPHCSLHFKRWSIKNIVFYNNFRTAGYQPSESDVLYKRLAKNRQLNGSWAAKFYGLCALLF